MAKKKNKTFNIKKIKLSKIDLVLLSIFVLIIFLIVVLFSYAFYSSLGTSQNISQYSTSVDCINVTYTESNTINLTNTHPVNKDYALLHFTPVTMTLHNACTNSVPINITINSISQKSLSYENDYIPTSKMKTIIVYNGSRPDDFYIDDLYESEKTSRIGSKIVSNFNDTSQYNNYNLQKINYMPVYEMKSNETLTVEVFFYIDFYEGNKEIESDFYYEDLYNYNYDNKYDNSSAGKRYEAYIGYIANVSDKNYLKDVLYASGHLWQSGLEGDGQRYTGVGDATENTTPKNFICFGTNDKAACINNPHTYMYRIIGVFDGSAKLIKYESLPTLYQWHNTKTETNWKNSNLFLGLNGTYFLNKSTYSYMQSSTWTDKITDWNWTNVNTNTLSESGPSYMNLTAQQVYLHEMNKSSKTSTIGSWTNSTGKIGLMYVSDYLLSLGSSGLNYIPNNNYDTLITSWIYLANNSFGYTADYYDTEWTISSYDFFDNEDISYLIGQEGSVDAASIDRAYSVRPVFYLNNDVKCSGGTGAFTDPYIIDIYSNKSGIFL